MIHELMLRLQKMKNAVRHAGMDSRHPGTQDASEGIHVSLDSSAPCWNDGITRLSTIAEPFVASFSKERI
jgi:hypothetical protein